MKGCYDTGDGYYDPTKRYIAKSNHVLRIVTKEEEDLIKRLFMVNADKNCGFRPHLYEYWTTGSSNQHRLICNEIELSSRRQSLTRLLGDAVHTPNYKGTESKLTIYTCLDGASFV
nr:unnamed protein product [Callosobruchus analis]